MRKTIRKIFATSEDVSVSDIIVALEAADVRYGALLDTLKNLDDPNDPEAGNMKLQEIRGQCRERHTEVQEALEGARQGYMDSWTKGERSRLVNDVKRRNHEMEKIIAKRSLDQFMRRPGGSEAKRRMTGLLRSTQS